MFFIVIYIFLKFEPELGKKLTNSLPADAANGVSRYLDLLGQKSAFCP